MERTAAFAGFACTGCGAAHDADGDGVVGRCPACAAPLDPVYDLDAVDPAAVEAAGRREGSMWRFDAVLPFAADDGVVSVDEGATPLVAAPSLADEFGLGRVLVKDEGRNPTGSVVDRGMALAVTAAAERGAEPVALAAAGDAAQSAAAYAGRAGLRSYGFVPSRAPFPVKALVNVHGGEMRVAGGRYPDAVAALEDDLAAEYTPLGAFETPYRHAGAATVAYEVAAALDWTAPDVVAVPVGTGELLVGLARGFDQLVRLGLCDRAPALLAAQPEGCAPVVEAVEAGADAPAVPERPDTICGELEIPDPAGGRAAIELLCDADAGHRVRAVPDADALEGAVATTATTGVEVGAAGGVAAAALDRWADERAGDEPGDRTAVLVNPAAGLKTPDVLRSHLMGQGV